MREADGSPHQESMAQNKASATIPLTRMDTETSAIGMIYRIPREARLNTRSRARLVGINATISRSDSNRPLSEDNFTINRFRCRWPKSSWMSDASRPRSLSCALINMPLRANCRSFAHFNRTIKARALRQSTMSNNTTHTHLERCHKVGARYHTDSGAKCKSGQTKRL